MSRWILKVQLGAEWEQCSFPSQAEALSTFLALVRDYRLKLRRAILLAPSAERVAALPEFETQRALHPAVLN